MTQDTAGFSRLEAAFGSAMPAAASPADALHPVLIKLASEGAPPPQAKEPRAISALLYAARCTMADFQALGEDPAVESIRLVADGSPARPADPAA